MCLCFNGQCDLFKVIHIIIINKFLAGGQHTFVRGLSRIKSDRVRSRVIDVHEMQMYYIV